MPAASQNAVITRKMPPDVTKAATYMHIEGIYAQIICCQIDAGEDLCQGKMLAISKEHDFIGRLFHFTLDES